jgi:hypothetical protein
MLINIGMGEIMSSILLHVGFFFCYYILSKRCCWHHKTCCTTISAFSFTMLLLDRILTHIVNHTSNTSYHLQYLYCQGGYVFGTKPYLITCVGYIFLSVHVYLFNVIESCTNANCWRQNHIHCHRHHFLD